MKEFLNVTNPRSKAGKAKAWIVDDDMWCGRVAHQRDRRPRTQACPKCGGKLISNVVNWICERTLSVEGKPATCDFATLPNGVSQRGTIGVTSPISPEVLVLMERYKLTMSNAASWRATKRIPGRINGLPYSQGVLVATDGILCLIEQEDRVYEGHLDWFEPDASASCNSSNTNKRRNKRAQAILEALLA